MPVAHSSAVDLSVDTLKLVPDSAVVVGTPVYAKPGGTVELAEATARSLARVIGLSTEVKGAGFPAEFILRGIVERTDWTAVAGTALLTIGAPYFLSITAGKITATAPAGASDIVARVGRAVTGTKLDVQTEQQTILRA